MRTSRFAHQAILLAATSCGAGGRIEPSACETLTVPPTTRLLVFTRTVGFRHESIPVALEAIRGIGMRNGFAVEHTEDPNRFTNAELAPFAAVVFLHTTGDVLNSQQQAAFEKFIRDGGGFAGIHSAADTEYEWPWYGELVGAYFKSHPAVQSATVQIKSADHPSTRCLPSTWSRSDEWYDYQSQPVAGIDVLATLDEASYQGGTMGMPHPISWARTFDGGKAWYTGMGHTPESWSDTLFIRHIAGGLLWAAAK